MSTPSRISSLASLKSPSTPNRPTTVALALPIHRSNVKFASSKRAIDFSAQLHSPAKRIHANSLSNSSSADSDDCHTALLISDEKCNDIAQMKEASNPYTIASDDVSQPSNMSLNEIEPVEAAISSSDVDLHHAHTCAVADSSATEVQRNATVVFLNGSFDGIYDASDQPLHSVGEASTREAFDATAVSDSALDDATQHVICAVTESVSNSVVDSVSSFSLQFSVPAQAQRHLRQCLLVKDFKTIATVIAKMTLSLSLRV